MTGPWPHPNSGMFYFRKVTPTDLWNQREKLLAMKLKVTHEVQRSLGTRDPKAAALAYKRVSLEVEEMWARWRSLLNDAPLRLTHKDIHALAGQDALAFLRAKEADPGELRIWQELVKHEIDAELSNCKPGPSIDRQRLFELGQWLMLLHRFDALDTIRGLLEQEPKGTPCHRALASLYRQTEDILKIWGVARANELVRQMGVRLDAETMASLRQRCGERLLDALGSLRVRWEEGDYSEPAWAQRIPPYEGPRPSSEKAAPPTTLKLTLEDIVDEEEKRGQDKTALMASRRGKAIATIKKYRRIVLEFSRFRKSELASTVTVSEVMRWMEALHKGGASRTTVRDKANTIRAVTHWGQRQTSGQLFPSGLPLEELAVPDREDVDSRSRTYSLEQAATILKASRQEVLAERRWVPWLLAYSGMRVGEAAQLTKEDFEEIEGHWFAHVRSDGDRTTKTHKSRKVPLHSAVVQEGLLEFVKSSASGPLFPRRTQANLYEWITETVFAGVANLPPASHAFRHLFEDLCRRYRVDAEAAHYISGRAFGREHAELASSSARGYGGSDVMLKGYAEELEKIVQIKV
ncbi:DUF6538 domain-containing protein [Rhizobium alvei]|uniref:Tyrosine-type recombinase/integrase n=1 Tax=Rhizobium alvei TaxID=1132659 RepID=A0ABT8YQ07_9HYPH|nr:tyrosine-type recombinase/integrase [Rhizobium alvei]MDO6965794.1 tyrosine-type recombinase/integrase [Rhizobium alvei]